uniref:Uncharacterized protein n=1 Tax=Chromera velia CCMP2878 TaxID=1169474 RepID=A0A0G4I337_9ALVE|eukprot:Cvel_10543.t1-p1 / transcript=Cvel_10543.t1 / gene=Cvel_10543 / organism=Chromera_velia_CCMP2878 / gene_product=hypothetical protein / transcript_product=hypothetical protein / location=Cvel_scaffold638:41776-45520(-) / protein_length=823 / sequence_SO=supercontig / SO=protein_coding / is_pseudo=false
MTLDAINRLGEKIDDLKRVMEGRFEQLIATNQANFRLLMEALTASSNQTKYGLAALRADVVPILNAVSSKLDGLANYAAIKSASTHVGELRRDIKALEAPAPSQGPPSQTEENGRHRSAVIVCDRGAASEENGSAEAAALKEFGVGIIERLPIRFQLGAVVSVLESLSPQGGHWQAGLVGTTLSSQLPNTDSWRAATEAVFGFATSLQKTVFDPKHTHTGVLEQKGRLVKDVIEKGLRASAPYKALLKAFGDAALKVTESESVRTKEAAIMRSRDVLPCMETLSTCLPFLNELRILGRSRKEVTEQLRQLMRASQSERKLVVDRRVEGTVVTKNVNGQVVSGPTPRHASFEMSKDEEELRRGFEAVTPPAEMLLAHLLGIGSFSLALHIDEIQAGFVTIDARGRDGSQRNPRSVSATCRLEFRCGDQRVTLAERRGSGSIGSTVRSGGMRNQQAQDSWRANNEGGLSTWNQGELLTSRPLKDFKIKWGNPPTGVGSPPGTVSNLKVEGALTKAQETLSSRLVADDTVVTAYREATNFLGYVRMALNLSDCELPRTPVSPDPLAALERPQFLAQLLSKKSASEARRFVNEAAERVPSPRVKTVVPIDSVLTETNTGLDLLAFLNTFEFCTNEADQTESKLAQYIPEQFRIPRVRWTRDAVSVASSTTTGGSTRSEVFMGTLFSPTLVHQIPIAIKKFPVSSIGGRNPGVKEFLDACKVDSPHAISPIGLTQTAGGIWLLMERCDMSLCAYLDELKDAYDRDDHPQRHRLSFPLRRRTHLQLRSCAVCMQSTRRSLCTTTSRRRTFSSRLVTSSRCWWVWLLVDQ